MLTGGAQIAVACPPPSGPPKPWPEVLEERYGGADHVLIGTIVEVRKIPSESGPNRARDRMQVSVAEMMKGDPQSSTLVETDNIDGLPSGCGYRLKVNTPYLIMERDRNLTMALPLDEASYGIDMDFTIKTIREFAAHARSKP
jgi:hypothetical protein